MCIIANNLILSSFDKTFKLTRQYINIISVPIYGGVMLLSKFNEIGKKYCKLTVIERAENYKNGSVQWYCLCDCGNPNKIKVRASSLRDGHTKSCGCLKKLKKFIQIKLFY